VSFKFFLIKSKSLSFFIYVAKKIFCCLNDHFDKTSNLGVNESSDNKDDGGEDGDEEVLRVEGAVKDVIGVDVVGGAGDGVVKKKEEAFTGFNLFELFFPVDDDDDDDDDDAIKSGIGAALFK